MKGSACNRTRIRCASGARFSGHAHTLPFDARDVATASRSLRDALEADDRQVLGTGAPLAEQRELSSEPRAIMERPKKVGIP